MSRVSVESENYRSEYQRLSDKLLYFRRSHYRRRASAEIDAFPAMWTIGVADLRPGQVGVRRRGEVIQKSGLWAAFIPPFNMVDWQLSAGTFNWQAYISIADLPEDLPKKAFGFPWQRDWQPQSEEEIFEILSQVKKPLFLNKEEKLSATAIKAKRLIDETFCDPEVGVADVAKLLNVSHSFMTRAFRKAYGLAPVSYRTKLRVFESTKLMLVEGYNVTTAGHEVGFVDISRFNKQFRSLMNAIPSQYCLQKRWRKAES